MEIFEMPWKRGQDIERSWPSFRHGERSDFGKYTVKSSSSPVMETVNICVLEMWPPKPRSWWLSEVGLLGVRKGSHEGGDPMMKLEAWEEAKGSTPIPCCYSSCSATSWCGERPLTGTASRCQQHALRLPGLSWNHRNLYPLQIYLASGILL